MLYRKCCRCGKSLPASEFHRRSDVQDGLQRYCKQCKRKHQRNSPTRAAVAAKYRRNNRKLCSARSEASRKKKPHLSAQASARWRAKDPERTNALRREWYRRNKARVLELANRRKGRIRHNLEMLSPAHRAEIQGFYDFCTIFPGYEVDHIVPLNGEFVSGLHVPWNLQVLPISQNRSKGNKFELDTGENPCERETEYGGAESGIRISGPGRRGRKSRRGGGGSG